jgi:CubicO group peptidase (beta-lactamase class C family)
LTIPLVTVPGEIAVYSDIGFILLGEALRILANADTFNGLFDHEIARPMRLDSTCYLPPATWQSRIAPTCDWNWRHRVLQGEVQDENCALLGGVAGHAGLFANCADILRLASEMMRPDGLFERRTIDLFSQRILGSRALGWDTPSAPSQAGQYFSARTVGHLGYTGTSLWIDLEQKIAVTLLTNRVYTGPDAPPLPNAAAIQQVRPTFHDALLREILSK